MEKMISDSCISRRQVLPQAARAGRDHGGPGGSHSRLSWTQQLLLNEIGIALIFPNVRGSTATEKRFRAGQRISARGHVQGHQYAV